LTYLLILLHDLETYIIWEYYWLFKIDVLIIRA